MRLEARGARRTLSVKVSCRGPRVRDRTGYRRAVRLYHSVVDALGYVAAVFATGSFVPQVWKTWRTRSAEDLSFLMLATHIVGMMLWLAYGVMIGAAPIVAANTVAVLLDVALIVLKIRHPLPRNP